MKESAATALVTLARKRYRLVRDKTTDRVYAVPQGEGEPICFPLLGDVLALAYFEHERKVASGERVIVGVNRYKEGDEEEVELHELDPQAERRQVERTDRVRTARDAQAAEAALERVREVARASDNLLPALRDALATMCTVGEICNALREEFGTYDAHLAP